MMNGNEIEIILTRIRNCYSSIRVLSLECISENNPEQIVGLLQKREEILSLISADEAKVAGVSTDDESSVPLREEIVSIVKAISIIDRQLEAAIRGHRDMISGKLGKLYRSSRAASAYAGHSIQ